LNYETGAKDSEISFLVGYEVAPQDQPPIWNEGDFFGTRFGKRPAADMKKQHPE